MSSHGMSNQQLTVNLKSIAVALGLFKYRTIAAIIRLGGVEISTNRASMLLRSAGATKNASGNSDLQDARTNRTATITPDEFNAFCAGLSLYLDQKDNE